MKKFIIVIFLLISSQALAETGVATVYKVTLQKIELCTAAPLADKNDTTCTGTTTVGTGNKTFDVASVTAGTEVGSFVSTAGLPIGTTFTHMKPTLTREITMKGYVEADSNCWCRTESDSTYNSTTGKYKSCSMECVSLAKLMLLPMQKKIYFMYKQIQRGMEQQFVQMQLVIADQINQQITVKTQRV